MPRTHRNKLVSLTKTPKRNTRSAKAGHMDVVQEAASSHPTCVVFVMTNQRTAYLQEVRSLWKNGSRIIVGKNRVVAKALGTDVESEVQPGLHAISQRLEGPVGLLFTTSEPAEVQEWFADYARDDFARAGSVATRDVILEQGPVMIVLDEAEQDKETLPHSLEPRLRQLGMPTELRRGVPTLTERFVVCKKGEKLTSERAQILKHLLIKDAKFRLIPIAHWTRDSGEVHNFTLSSADEAIVKLAQQTGQGKKLNSAAARQKSGANRKQAGIKAAAASVDDDDDDDDDDFADEDLSDEEDPDADMMMPAGV